MRSVAEHSLVRPKMLYFIKVFNSIEKVTISISTDSFFLSSYVCPIQQREMSKSK